MKLISITCISVALLQLAVAVRSHLALTPAVDPVIEEIAMCKAVKTAALTDLQLVSQQLIQGGSADQAFVMEAAEAGMAEVALAKLASEKGSSTAVRDFARLMITDHAKANEELKALAQKKGIALPGECEKCQQKLTDLEKLSGKEFDRKYMEMMVADHKEVVSKFTTESSQGKDPDLKSWAEKKLPTLQHHLNSAASFKQ